MTAITFIRDLFDLLLVFALAIFVGFEVISKVPTTLLTALAFAAVVLGTINVVGGFAVTERMLQMFKKKEPAKK